LDANIEAVREMMGHADLATTSPSLHATSGDKVHAIGVLAGNRRETAWDAVTKGYGALCFVVG
jgi:hypothetical protein